MKFLIALVFIWIVIAVFAGLAAMGWAVISNPSANKGGVAPEAVSVGVDMAKVVLLLPYKLVRSLW